MKGGLYKHLNFEVNFASRQNSENDVIGNCHCLIRNFNNSNKLKYIFQQIKNIIFKLFKFFLFLK